MALCASISHLCRWSGSSEVTASHSNVCAHMAEHATSGDYLSRWACFSLTKSKSSLPCFSEYDIPKSTAASSSISSTRSRPKYATDRIIGKIEAPTGHLAARLRSSRFMELPCLMKKLLQLTDGAVRIPAAAFPKFGAFEVACVSSM